MLRLLEVFHGRNGNLPSLALEKLNLRSSGVNGEPTGVNTSSSGWGGLKRVGRGQQQGM